MIMSTLATDHRPTVITLSEHSNRGPVTLGLGLRGCNPVAVNFEQLPIFFTNNCGFNNKDSPK